MIVCLHSTFMQGLCESARRTLENGEACRHSAQRTYTTAFWHGVRRDPHSPGTVVVRVWVPDRSLAVNGERRGAWSAGSIRVRNLPNIVQNQDSACKTELDESTHAQPALVSGTRDRHSDRFGTPSRVALTSRRKLLFSRIAWSFGVMRRLAIRAA
jgi:hypothetical protein